MRRFTNDDRQPLFPILPVESFQETVEDACGEPNGHHVFTRGRPAHVGVHRQLWHVTRFAAVVGKVDVAIDEQRPPTKIDKTAYIVNKLFVFIHCPVNVGVDHAILDVDALRHMARVPELFQNRVYSVHH